jgi:hypothetical protein
VRRTKIYWLNKEVSGERIIFENKGKVELRN